MFVCLPTRLVFVSDSSIVSELRGIFINLKKKKKKTIDSYRLPRIPAMFNKVLDKREAKARSMLEDVLKSQ